MFLFTNLIIDLIIFTALLVAFQPILTGIPFHEWFSIGLTGMVIIHLLLHWKWMILVTVRFFKSLLHPSRLDYIVDTLLFIAFTIAIVTGLLISESIVVVFGLHASHTPIWLELHVLSANLTLVLTGLHFALHWKWFTNTFGRYIITPISGNLRKRSWWTDHATERTERKQPVR